MATFKNETHGWKLVLNDEILQEDLEKFDDLVSKEKTERRVQENSAMVKSAMGAEWIKEISPKIENADRLGKENPKFISWIASKIKSVYYDFLIVPND